MKDNFNRGVYIYIGILLVLAFLSAYYILPIFIPQEALEAHGKIGNRIIDGDTFEYNGEIIRLICVDAPEKGEEGYGEASDFLGSLIIGGELKLEKDVSNKDKYGRLLRYVYVGNGDEEIFVNKEMVASGNAEVFRYGEDTKKCDEIAGLN
jgi:endonuclease YncB( thermonuclease family)